MDAAVLYGMRHLKTVGAQLGAVDHLSLWWWLDRGITDTCDRMLTDNHTAVTGGGGGVSSCICGMEGTHL